VARAADASATIRDFAFAPKSITIEEGETVTWTNNGPSVHTATARNGSFDTGNLARGQTGSHTFDSPGTFAYYCRPHPNMTGTITVRAAGGGGGGGSEGGSGGLSDSGTAGESASGDTGSQDAGSDDPDLANTGIEASILAAIGALLLTAGAGLRRRLRREP
jgi:LPXTG-motif cell wall-anchored protein